MDALTASIRTLEAGAEKPPPPPPEDPRVAELVVMAEALEQRLSEQELTAGGGKGGSEAVLAVAKTIGEKIAEAMGQGGGAGSTQDLKAIKEQLTYVYFAVGMVSVLALAALAFALA